MKIHKTKLARFQSSACVGDLIGDSIRRATGEVKGPNGLGITKSSFGSSPEKSKEGGGEHRIYAQLNSSDSPGLKYRAPPARLGS